MSVPSELHVVDSSICSPSAGLLCAKGSQASRTASASAMAKPLCNAQSGRAGANQQATERAPAAMCQ